MRQIAHSLRAAVLASLVLFFSAGVASADSAVGDGDGLVPLNAKNLDFGSSVCLGSTTTKPVALGVEHQSNGSKVFKSGSTVTFSVTSITGSGLSAATGAPSSIVLPQNWASLPNKTVTETAATAQVT